MFKKAGNYEKARKVFAEMAARGVPQTTVTYNSLMSFETNYKEVSKIYDQVSQYGWTLCYLPILFLCECKFEEFLVQ